MDIRLDKAPHDQQPAEGWHQFPDGRLGHVTCQGQEQYALQIFAPGQVDHDNIEKMAERSRRLAWACFAAMDEPGPSQPKPRAP